MGIDVNNNSVTYNGTHQHLIDTSITTNPRSTLISDGFIVNSVFRRMISAKGQGDGNPLIYALKAKNGFSITPREITKFLPELNHIVTKCIASKKDAVFILMPSSHQVTKIFARRAARCVANAGIMTHFFIKKTFSEVYLELQHTQFSKEQKKDGIKLLDTLIKTPHVIFSMKEVKRPDLRRLINPLKLNNKLLPAHAHIILVDDLISSGSTLRNAYSLLKDSGITKPITGLCLLGPL